MTSRKHTYGIRIYPDPVLRQVAHAVDTVDGPTVDVLRAMVSQMYARGGIGLAATQVGVLRRMIIADVGDGLVSFINPLILDRSGESSLLEGCLSLPDIGVHITRSERITVTGLDREGAETTLEPDGLMARVIQHEIDHLDGILIIDHGPQIDLREHENAQPHAG